MKKIIFTSLHLYILTFFAFGEAFAQDYVPTEENLQSRKEFSNERLGIFLHWGLYSMFAQGEWYMQNRAIPYEEYSKSARGFYPAHFDANEWVSAIKDSGAGYICFTSRHHEGFSMWDTDESDYNIVDATPFKRDIIKELADACHAQDLRLHFYYSHLDWGREDYPMGRTGHGCKDSLKADWPHYYQFMNNQLTELLTRYGKIGAIWFDGWWDHDVDPTPFDWQLDEQYALIHRLQPWCLIGNNHHMAVNPGEDIQIFERDLPGENTAGFVDKAADVSRLPLETCQTMNGMWGYRIQDQDYKSVKEIIHLLVRTSGKGANLLLNIGPQPSGELPATALDRLKGMGQWMRQYGETIKGTEAGDIKEQPWGATTRKGDKLFVHILQKDSIEGGKLLLPQESLKGSKGSSSSSSSSGSKGSKGSKVQVTAFDTGKAVPFSKTKEGITLDVSALPNDKIDNIIVISVK